MNDENAEATEVFDPSQHTADEVVAEMQTADPDEKNRIAGAEAAGKARKSVLAEADVKEGERLDASGRRLFPWEVVPTPKED